MTLFFCCGSLLFRPFRMRSVFMQIFRKLSTTHYFFFARNWRTQLMKTDSDEDFFYDRAFKHSPLPFDMAVEHVSTHFFSSSSSSLAHFFFCKYIVFSLWFLLKLCAFLFLSPLTHRQIESLPYISKMSAQLTHYLKFSSMTTTMAMVTTTTWQTINQIQYIITIFSIVLCIIFHFIVMACDWMAEIRFRFKSPKCCSLLPASSICAQIFVVYFYFWSWSIKIGLRPGRFVFTNRNIQMKHTKKWSISSGRAHFQMDREQVYAI